MNFLENFFHIEYGQHEYSSKSELKKGKIPLISSKGTKRGIYGYFSIEPKYSHVISVPRTGTICQAFYQEKDCCIDDNCLVLIPKKKLTKEEMIYFSLLIRKEKYKYVYGRQVTPERLGKTKINPKIINWVNKKRKINYNGVKKSISKIKLNFNTKNWKSFRYDEIFDIKKGYYNKKPPISEKGKIPFIGATDSKNGITSHHKKETIKNYNKIGEIEINEKEKRIFSGNCITVSNNGSVGYAFYQPINFTCSHDINPLYIKNKKMNTYLALFLCAIIGLEKYRWSYGRKWRPLRMPSSIIKLPINKEGNPDWQFMEDYIKSLPYSKSLQN